MHERFLDYDDVAQVLAQMGFVDAQKRPFTADRIRGWANRRALPFSGPRQKAAYFRVCFNESHQGNAE